MDRVIARAESKMMHDAETHTRSVSQLRSQAREYIVRNPHATGRGLSRKQTNGNVNQSGGGVLDQLIENLNRIGASASISALNSKIQAISSALWGANARLGGITFPASGDLDDLERQLNESYADIYASSGSHIELVRDKTIDDAVRDARELIESARVDLERVAESEETKADDDFEERVIQMIVQLDAIRTRMDADIASFEEQIRFKYTGDIVPTNSTMLHIVSEHRGKIRAASGAVKLLHRIHDTDDDDVRRYQIGRQIQTGGDVTTLVERLASTHSATKQAIERRNAMAVDHLSHILFVVYIISGTINGIGSFRVEYDQMTKQVLNYYRDVAAKFSMHMINDANHPAICNIKQYHRVAVQMVTNMLSSDTFSSTQQHGINILATNVDEIREKFVLFNNIKEAYHVYDVAMLDASDWSRRKIRPYIASAPDIHATVLLTHCVQRLYVGRTVCIVADHKSRIGEIIASTVAQVSRVESMSVQCAKMNDVSNLVPVYTRTNISDALKSIKTYNRNEFGVLVYVCELHFVDNQTAKLIVIDVNADINAADLKPGVSAEFIDDLLFTEHVYLAGGDSRFFLALIAQGETAFIGRALKSKLSETFIDYDQVKTAIESARAMDTFLDIVGTGRKANNRFHRDILNAALTLALQDGHSGRPQQEIIQRLRENLAYTSRMIIPGTVNTLEQFMRSHGVAGVDIISFDPLQNAVQEHARRYLARNGGRVALEQKLAEINAEINTKHGK